MSGDHLAPPTNHFINPEYTVPLSPPARPPFQHYHSSSTLPATPQTPYPRRDFPSGAVQSNENHTQLREFIGFRARIILTTLSPALLPLILTIAHLIQNRSSTASLADSFKNSLLAACGGLATGASGLLTMPRYLAMQTNEQAVRATQASILAIGSAIMDCVTIIEKVVIFIVETYRSMLLCTIELVVRGTLEVLISAVKTISDGITSSLNSIRTNIQGDIASANNFIQEAVDKINSLTSKININIFVPEFSIPSISALENVAIPTGFEDSLIKLNTTLPTLAELKEKMNELLEIPFEALKKEINETRIEMAASFNSSILPVPPLSQLAASKSNDLNNELCADLDTSLIDDTAKALHKLSNVAIGLMFLLLFLVWAFLVFWEWRRWRALKDTVETIEDEWESDGRRDAWRCVAVVENPVLEKYGSPILTRLAPNRRTRINLRWYMSYLAHPTCLALLFIALLGFLSIQFQLVALNAIKSHAKDNANATVTQSSNDLTAKLNQMALASSQQYATDFNAAIDRYEDRINNELFGHWLNTTAISLNATINEFYDGVQDALYKTFGGTILFNPVNTFMYCILGSKVDTIEQGLTWISQHAQVSLPKLPPDVLLLSDSSMNEIAQPISAAAVGSSSDGDDDGMVGSLIRHFESALRVERTFYAILLGIWLAFAMVGLVVVIWNSGGADRYHAWRGIQPDSEDGTGKRSPKAHPIYDHHTEEEKQFRGLAPSPVPPHVVEPDNTDKESFFNYGAPSRPYVPRNGTFVSTISSLAAPGQAFLKLTGRSKTDEDAQKLTDGNTSEKYNSFADPGQGREEEEVSTPPPFWVNKWYRAVDSARSFFPTRGQRRGEAVAHTGTRREPSCNIDRHSDEEQRSREPGGWTIVDPPTIGRATDYEDQTRYPTTGGASYPRRLSRAPTLKGATTVKDVFADPIPSQRTVFDKHDSVDYMYDSEHEDEGTANRSYDSMAVLDFSAPSSGSYTGEGTRPRQGGAEALAAVIADMKRRDEDPKDPFVSAEERWVGRGTRI